MISDHRKCIMHASRCKHSSVRTTSRPSTTSSVICMLPWTTALHLARPTPLRTRSWWRRSYIWWQSSASYFWSRCEMQRMITYVRWCQRPPHHCQPRPMMGMLMRVRHCQPSAPRQTAGRSASLKLLATTGVTLVPAADSDFDRFLAAPAPSGVKALCWWRMSRTSVLHAWRATR